MKQGRQRGLVAAMELEAIKEQGRLLGLNPFILQGSKKSLIQAIQQARGEQACFLDDARFSCARHECEWRSECMKLTAVWRR